MISSGLLSFSSRLSRQDLMVFWVLCRDLVLVISIMPSWDFNNIVLRQHLNLVRAN